RVVTALPYLRRPGALHCPMIVQILGRPAADPERTQSTIVIDVPAGVPRRQAGAGVAQHHHWKLEPFGLVHGHQPDAVTSLFENRRFRSLASLRRLAE